MPGGAGNARHWLRRARAAGARVYTNASGETIVQKGKRRARIDAKRKDATRILVSVVRNIEKENE